MSKAADWVARLTLVEARERVPTLLSFLMIFTLMAAYFVLRPVRDALASDWSDAELSLLWNLQLLISLGLVAIYSIAVSRFPRRVIVPNFYLFFALSFVGFFIAAPRVSDAALLDKAFYLWVTAFSLFNVSVFWSFMTDLYEPEQSQRLFAIIASGASAGALLGPAIPTLFAGYLGLEGLMLVAAGGVAGAVPMVLVLQRYRGAPTRSTPQSRERIDPPGSGDKPWWSGFRDAIGNPYLRGIAFFILLYVFIGSFLYFIQKNLLADFSRVERTQILGGISWLVNALTFSCALFVTGRFVQRAGMAIALASVPVLILLGMLVIAFAPLIVVLLAVDVGRRVGNYAITKPAREMLFTRVTVDQRFKAKPVIDVAIYRGGDAVSGSLFALLTDGLGLALSAMALMGAGVAALWALVGARLGRRYRGEDISPRSSNPVGVDETRPLSAL